MCLRWKNNLAVGRQGIAQVTVRIAAYSPALGKGFPNVIVLFWQERAFPAKLLQLDSGARSVTTLLC